MFAIYSLNNYIMKTTAIELTDEEATTLEKSKPSSKKPRSSTETGKTCLEIFGKEPEEVARILVESWRKEGRSFPLPQSASLYGKLSPEMTKEFLTVCDILEEDPETFAAVIVHRYIREISTDGRLCELEVSSMKFNTPAEAKRIKRRAEAYDKPRHEADMAALYSRPSPPKAESDELITLEFLDADGKPYSKLDLQLSVWQKVEGKAAEIGVSAEKYLIWLLEKATGLKKEVA